jgi:hypothetical protein
VCGLWTSNLSIIWELDRNVNSCGSDTLDIGPGDLELSRWLCHMLKFESHCKLCSEIWLVWGLNSGPHACWVGTWATPQPFLQIVIFVQVQPWTMILLPLPPM